MIPVSGKEAARERQGPQETQEDMNKYRNASGARMTAALFWENTSDKSTVLYTLKDHDHDGYPSLYRLYMGAGDLLEYEFANTYLDGWEHWQMLCECSWFIPYITRWRHELELRVRSEALRRLQDDAKSPSRSAAASNRFLLERGWADKNTKGRPSKDQIKAEAQREAQSRRDLEEDFARVLPAPALPQ